MKNLSPLICVEINEYDNISHCKRKDNRHGRLLILRPRISADYNTYNMNFGTIHSRLPSRYINGTEREDLLHCYNNSTIALESLIKRIEENQTAEMQHICAYCLYNKIEETDHYIPKENYAEFCVLASNLVPICSVCNKAKSRNWRNTTLTNRTFIHPYMDILPNLQFLFGTITYVNNLPQINWTVNNNGNLIAVQLFSIIQDHFDKLHLANRYKKACNELIAEIDLTVRTQRRINPGIQGLQISNLLNAESIEEEICYGLNYWKSIARRILANDQRFINSL